MSTAWSSYIWTLVWSWIIRPFVPETLMFPEFHRTDQVGLLYQEASSGTFVRVDLRYSRLELCDKWIKHPDLLFRWSGAGNEDHHYDGLGELPSYHLFSRIHTLTTFLHCLMNPGSRREVVRKIYGRDVVEDCMEICGLKTPDGESSLGQLTRREKTAKHDPRTLVRTDKWYLPIITSHAS